MRARAGEGLVREIDFATTGAVKGMALIYIAMAMRPGETSARPCRLWRIGQGRKTTPKTISTTTKMTSDA